MTAAVYITATGAFLPNTPAGNDDMERVLGQVGEKPSRARRTILRSNGIVSRHYAIDPDTLQPTHSNAQLAAEAVRALEAEQEKIDCLACGTSIADQLMPGHASMVQGELALQACDVVSTGGVCVAGITALKYAVNTVRTGDCRYAVATGSELSSASMHASNFAGENDSRIDALEKKPELAFEKDFLRWMLSDGAGAVLLENAPRQTGISLRVDWIDILSYAGEMETCMYAGAIKQGDSELRGWQQYSAAQRDSESVMAVKQDVKLLNEQVIDYTVEKPLQAIIKKRELTAEAIDYFLPHYSSLFFRDKVHAGMQRAGLDIPFTRWFTNLASKGNTGSASIYIMLDELFRSGTLKPGDRLLCYIPESGRFSTAFMHLTVVAPAGKNHGT
jgi:3-oxoacyl-[acyl-carrier-protein] synthase-3